MTPVIGLEPRLREIGRIRAGEKGAKGEPKALENWRLTSASKSVLEEASALWGGEVRPWDDDKNGQGQFEVYLSTNVIPIQVPHMREPITSWYEAWTGGGCVHRCDGEVDDLSGDPCSCNPEHRKMAGKGDHPCKLTTRAKFFLPDLPGVGVWRLESHGYSAAVELTGSISLINLAAAEGIGISGSLRLEKRTSVSQGRTNRFVVAVIDIDTNLRELSGRMTGELQTPRRAEILAPKTVELPATSLVMEGVEDGPDGHLVMVGQFISPEEWDAFQESVESDGINTDELRQIVSSVVGKVTKSLTQDQLAQVSMAVIEAKKAKDAQAD